MVEICLSVAPILRCQTLSKLESGVLLVPPGLEILFAIILLYVKRASDKRDVFIALEAFVYLLLAVFDVLSHTVPSFGTTLTSFKSIDIVIGVGSFIPLLLYTIGLYLLTATEFIPSLPMRFQNTAKYVLLAFIPLIALLNELSSFVGITYTSVGGTNGQPLGLFVGFANAVARNALSSVTLVLVTAFQALNFCVAFYHLFRALSHQRSLEQNEKGMETHLFRGLGWIVAGTKLGAIETVIGFAQGGFAIAMTRRVLRLLSRACLIIGLIKGVDTVEDFQLYSPTEARKRRKSMLRAIIHNPRLSTFRHVGGHDFDKQDPLDEKRQSVIRVGDPSWMRRDYRAGLIDEERATLGLPKRKSTLTFLTNRPSTTRSRKTSSARDSGSSFGSTRRTSWSYAESPMDEFQDDQEDTDLSGITVVPRVATGARQVHQRVTVHMRKDRLPVLELRRFSNLDFLDLIHDPFRDPHTRSQSLPMPSRSVEHPAIPLSAPLTRLRSYSDARSLQPPASLVPSIPVPALPAPAVHPPSVRDSVESRYSRTMSLASYDRPWGSTLPRAALPMNARASAVTFGPPHDSFSTLNQSRRLSVAPPNPRGSTLSYAGRRPRSSLAVGSSSGTIASWETPGSSTVPAAAGLMPMSRRDRGLSSSTTVSEVHAIALQFPGIPGRPPPRRSMLSQEVRRSEFFESDSEELEPESEVAPVPSVKRRPSPLITEGLVDARMRNVEIEQVVDDLGDDVREVLASTTLPTPMSLPRFQPVQPRAHSASRVVDVPSTPSSSDAGSIDPREVEVVRSGSIVRRNMEPERGKLVRVKSVGNAPRRSVSSSRRVVFARDSIAVELGHIAREGKFTVSGHGASRTERTGEEVADGEAVDIEV